MKKNKIGRFLNKVLSWFSIELGMFLKPSIFNNQGGALAQVLIASAVLSTIIAGVSQQMVTQRKIQLRESAKRARDAIGTRIERLLQTPDSIHESGLLKKMSSCDLKSQEAALTGNFELKHCINSYKSGEVEAECKANAWTEFTLQSVAVLNCEFNDWQNFHPSSFDCDTKIPIDTPNLPYCPNTYDGLREFASRDHTFLQWIAGLSKSLDIVPKNILRGVWQDEAMAQCFGEGLVGDYEVIPSQLS